MLPVSPGIVDGPGQRIFHMLFIFQHCSHFDLYIDHLFFKTFGIVFSVINETEFILVYHFY